MQKQPKLNKNISVKDFKDFYWYKEELLEFCRTEKLDKRGGKLELAKRIEEYLATGIRKEYKKLTNEVSSRFDWNTEKLSIETILTDNYKNTENVRAFFKQQIGDAFKFNVQFMNWMKTSQGKNLGDAVNKWKDIASQNKKDKSPKNIAPQFEYNTYIRDFLKDNTDKTRDDAIACWKIKKTIRGNNKYTPKDLELI